jgi:molecular chaperone IbpA
VNAYDLSPLFRTAIGFDRLARTLETARTASDGNGYPPYNIEKTGEDSYVLTMAVAGFGPNDLEIVVRDNALTVTGRAPQAEEGRSYLHRGIAGRAFERRFVLADHMVVQGAGLENGLLQIELRRVVPEQLKPRRIPVLAGSLAQAQPSLVQDQAPAAPQAEAA